MIRTISLILVIFIWAVSASSAQINKVTLKDLKALNGTWFGSLTYLDYTSGKPYTMPADVKVSIIKKKNCLLLVNIYPNEPSANSTDSLKISKDGAYMNKGAVKTVEKLADGSLKITTEHLGFDGNDGKAATIRHTYTVGNQSFIIRKDVKFNDQAEWIKRHEFSYKRIKS